MSSYEKYRISKLALRAQRMNKIEQYFGKSTLYYTTLQFSIHVSQNIVNRITQKKKKNKTETVMMRQIGRKEFFRQNEASNLEKIT